MFTDKDLTQIQAKGISIDQVEQQILNFQKGFPFMDIVAPATLTDGILKLSEYQLSNYIAIYEKDAESKKVVKFVPASGAASRMFKSLFAFIDEYDGSQEGYKAYIADDGFNSVQNFMNEIERFAFYPQLNELYLEKYGKDLPEAIEDKEFVQILKLLLTKEGLNYGQKPKGLLSFHSYGSKARTPLEEHLVEGAKYAQTDSVVNIHFTVSGEHQEGFVELTGNVLKQYESEFGVKYEISYSEQKSSTDTIAVDLKNQPFRNGGDEILFRPGGHGALIENLNDLDADIVFIKNIDNVVPDSLKKDTIQYKKALAGVLCSYQEKIFNYLHQLDKDADEAFVEEVMEFLEVELYVKVDAGFDSFDQKLAFVKAKLNRPIRVCGMVKNEGEPGGGPFWVKNLDGSVSLQIVESSQIDSSNDEKATIVAKATHFNPVDLICAVKDYQGAKFDLKKYVDPSAGFISSKSKNGKELKAMELPGLWNGAMSDWNTFFVEVPLSTFNPVKTVADLLRPAHQA